MNTLRLPTTRRGCLRALPRLCLSWGGLAGFAHALAGEERALPIDLVASDDVPVLGDNPAWRALYLDFWASWCGPCRQSFPWLNEMQQRHAQAGLRIVGVGLDRDAAQAQEFIRRTGPRFAIALDPEAHSARRMAVRAMPTSFIVSRDRRILHAHRGFRLDDRPELERRIAAALA